MKMSHSRQSKSSSLSIVPAIVFAGLLSIPILYILSLLNGVDPFGCPPGTKTISSPGSIEKWCLEE